jgi:hypothetical protein
VLLVDPPPVFVEIGTEDSEHHSAQGLDPAVDEGYVEVLEDEERWGACCGDDGGIHALEPGRRRTRGEDDFCGGEVRD